MMGPDSQAYKAIEKCTRFLIGDAVVSIDPSVGSHSSMPGWAVFRNGVFVARGTFPIDPTMSIPDKLHALNTAVRKLYDQVQPTVLVYEEIPASRHGGSAASQATLHKALGAILSVPGPDYYVGIYPISWQALARDTYVKGDAEDAHEIGYVAIEQAREIERTGPQKKRKKKRKPTKAV